MPSTKYFIISKMGSDGRVRLRFAVIDFFRLKVHNKTI